MKKELWLLRHSKAEHSSVYVDFDRPLTKQGVINSHRIGQWLKKQQLVPDIILSSPAIRALTTAMIVAEEISINTKNIELNQQLYFQGIIPIKKVLADYLKLYQRILLVGHNPDLESLLTNLVGSNNEFPTDCLATSSCARLQLINDYEQQLVSGSFVLLSINEVNRLTNIVEQTFESI